MALLLVDTGIIQLANERIVNTWEVWGDMRENKIHIIPFILSSNQITPLG